MTTTSATPPLPLRDSTEIQGDVIAGFRKDFVCLLFLQFVDRTRAQAWLADLTPKIATTRQVAAFNRRFSSARRTSGGDDPETLKATWLGVSFTHPGIQLLSGDPAPVPRAPEGTTLEAFAAGAWERAVDLGDVDDSAREHWLFGHNGGRTIHAVLTVASDAPEDLQVAIEAQREAATRAAAVIVFQQNAATLTGERRGKEHFGFKDGVSEPGVAGYDEEDPRRKGYAKAHPGTRLVPPGEFVVGHPRVEVEGDRRRYPAADMPSWMTDGSFQVIRRLAQDVPGWWAQVADQLATLKQVKGAVPANAGVEWLAARMVGRWRSGAPVHTCPTHDPVNDPSATNDNDLSFADDPDGLRTPLFSHLRQSAPRDGLVDGGPVPERFMDARRIMRRGAPYGQPFDPTSGTAGGPDAARGLLFVCYQADLVEQFEFIQKHWINTDDFPPGRKAKPGPDGMIAGRLPDENAGVLHYESAAPDGTGRTTTPLEVRRFVRTEGAVYAFAPSISALKALAQGRLPGGTPTAARVDALLAVPDVQRVGGASHFWMFQRDRLRTVVLPDGQDTTDLVLRPTQDFAGWPALEGVSSVDTIVPIPDLQRVGGRSRYWLFHTVSGTQVYRIVSVADGAAHTTKVEVADRGLDLWRSLAGVSRVDAVLPVPDMQRVGGVSWYWVFHTVAAGGRERQVYRLVSIADGDRHTDTRLRDDAGLDLWPSLTGIDRVDAFLPVPTMQRAAGKSHFWAFHPGGVRTVSIADGEQHTDTRVHDDRPLRDWVNLG
ncbi:Dyp-type peroxidase [Streptacidiphilus neutrinimicus]|uniref:Dyp-type peroxidase n=1 Tax=Streptacidiphilus neutrinimicus TaxID=105420 RepID=UPI000693D82B|nr:Dyp-type peroxidase [Streptacidiphilus neutrinimicus]